jgi:hypothetical protein
VRQEERCTIYGKRTTLGRKEKKKQEMVNELNIIKGFPKVVWDYCTFTFE